MSVQRRPDGAIVFRDVVTSVGIRLVEKDTLTFVLRPGLRLPTGGLADGLAFTPLSTASVDPWLSAELVGGSTWIGATSLQVQAPLYAGWDARRQGVYGRFDVRGGRRIGAGVVWLGPSMIARTKDDLGQDAFHEIAATAGATWAVHPRASITGQVRVPVEMGPRRAYEVAAGVGFTWVVGKARVREEEEDEEDHGEEEEDGHGH